MQHGSKIEKDFNSATPALKRSPFRLTVSGDFFHIISSVRRAINTAVLFSRRVALKTFSCDYIDID